MKIYGINEKGPLGNKLYSLGIFVCILFHVCMLFWLDG